MMCVLMQLPPDFVDQAIQKANQPAGASEHYTQIFHACGGGENGTAIVSSCLEEVEYCVRPIQGHPGIRSRMLTYADVCCLLRPPHPGPPCIRSMRNAYGFSWAERFS